MARGGKRKVAVNMRTDLGSRTIDKEIVVL